MNVLWCNALNAARTEGVTHFAMIHADIEPALDQDWLNIMLAEMEKYDLDFISAVVPIKDSRGLTTCGIGDPKDPWVPFRRFTMYEVHSFPETFNQDDTGYPSTDWYLNHNSGMIMADLRKPVFRKSLPDGEMAIWFEFKKRMFFDQEGEAHLVGESEDWNISRRLWLAGAKTAVTRKPALKHYGMTGYPNTHGWGQYAHDEGCRYKWDRFDPIGDVSMPPDPMASVYAVIEQGKINAIRGWLFRNEQEELERLAAGKKVIEFGSYCGKSTVVMARVAEHVTTVDDFRGVHPKALPDSSGRVTTWGHEAGLEEEFRRNIERNGVKDKVTLIVGSVENVIDTIAFDDVGLLFYDADHSYEATKRYGDKLLGRRPPACTVAFHDFSKADPGVMRAVRELAQEYGKGFRIVNTLAIFDGVAA